MDCPNCNGNGELEELHEEEMSFRNDGNVSQVGNRVRVCPVCNGSGYIEQI